VGLLLSENDVLKGFRKSKISENNLKIWVVKPESLKDLSKF
jgi:hypothetical protein